MSPLLNASAGDLVHQFLQRAINGIDGMVLLVEEEIDLTERFSPFV